MIAYLNGTIIKKSENYIISNVAEVGYKVEMTARNINKLKLSDIVEIWIYTFVREDAFRLIGFLSQEELDLFEKLLSVSGVGPKVALAILEVDKNDIINAINAKKLSDIKISGVGKKTLEKVHIELHGKVGVGDSNSNIMANLINAQNEELIEALLSLGYKKLEIVNMIKKKQSLLTGKIEKDVKVILKR